ncbi:host attachment protein [Dongia soli]|uniref:Host attachment protein n=1 Tax=Dongia soli TaxID=600628 RepID=A0ABU5EF66_9PROT|nr:host attachment protein [Dongia soli]MDY0884103.1 host attachment protein [Dongia soli]
MTIMVKHSTSWILVADASYAQLWASHRRGQVRALGTISRIRPPLDVLREFIAEPAAGDPRPAAAPPLVGRSLPDKDLREASDVHLNKCDWFAGELAQYLERCMQWHEFQHLVLVAPTNMLLALRGNLSGAMRSMVGVEVDQDLIKSSRTQIQARLRSLAIN